MSKIVLPLRMRVGRYNAQIAIKNRAVSPDRKVACFEIEVPIEKGGISYISGQTRPITKDLVICAKPGDLRHTRLPYKCYYLHIAVREGLLFDTLTRLPPFVENADTEHIRGLFEKLCRCHVSERAENEFLQQSLLLELIYEIHAAVRGGQKKRGQQAVDAASAYIKKNLTAELDLATVASEVKFAPSYFDKLFKAATGKTLHRYIEDLRIERAIRLLVTTDMTLTQIAYECGFSSQSYFSYAFKRHTGTTPRAYARKTAAFYDDALSPQRES